MNLFSRLFTHHPEAAGESYLQHMAFALRFGTRLLRASLAAYAHAMVPGVCETTASTAILGMHEEIRTRRAKLAESARPQPAR